MLTSTMSPGRTLLACLILVAPVTAFGQDCPLPCESPTMDGYTYDVVQIGEQCWFAENLRTTVFADGVTPVPNVVDSATWTINYNPASVVYGAGTVACAHSSPLFDSCDEEAALQEFGRLYNAFAVDHPSGLCPTGWHVPSEEEWLTLKDHVATVVPADEDGTALKSETGWWNEGNGTDVFGFAAKPGGSRSHFGAEFADAGLFGRFWSSTPAGTSLKRMASLNNAQSAMYFFNFQKRYGLSVRCLADPPTPGCTNPLACNYDATAGIDDGSCQTNDALGVCGGDCVADANGNGVCDDVEEGCTVPGYVEYNPEAITDDGSCQHPVNPACTAPTMDGYTYDVVQIGGQCWFSENLKTTTLADGTPLLQGFDQMGWSEVGAPALTYYQEGGLCYESPVPDFDICDVSALIDNYGYLYNGYAVLDSAGLCPTGWQLPSLSDWMTLASTVSPAVDGSVGMALKSTVGWNGDGNGTDAVGFNGRPGGDADPFEFYTVTSAGNYGFWWSSTQVGDFLHYRFLGAVEPDLMAGDAALELGYSVRCMLPVDTALVPGCTQSEACNYDPLATVDNGTCILEGFDIQISIVPDDYPDETSWELQDEIGAVVASGDGWSEGAESGAWLNTNLCLPAGCYTWTISDDFGDGICCGYGSGQYAIVLDGDTALQGGQFGYMEAVTFCAGPEYGCTDFYACNYDPNAATLDGLCQYDCAPCGADVNENGICDEDETGCTEEGFIEYDATAAFDDGSCQFEVDYDCTSPTMDGYTYDVVQIGNDCWFAENLRTTVYRDGTPIPGNLDNAAWLAATDGAMATYGDSTALCTESQYGPDFNECDPVLSLASYGRLYNGYTILNPKGVCPAGWRVPTESHWRGLELMAGMPNEEVDLFNQYRGDGSGVGTRLKATEGWYESPSTENGTDDFGFRGLPGGRRNYTGSFESAGNMGGWWVSGLLEGPAAFRQLSSAHDGVALYYQNWAFGYSVRCVLDGPTANVFGCTDSTSCTYDSAATLDDGYCLYGSLEASLTVQFDDYPDETTWTLEDEEGMLVLFGSYTFGIEQVVQTICLEPGCYTFTIYDDYGDGMCCQWGDGFFSLAIEGDTLEGGQFAWLDSWYFCVGPDYGCIDPSACNFDPDAWDASGLCDYDCNGCTNDQALNYAPSATIDDGSCLYGGCTDSTASNYDSGAAFDNGSCVLPGCTQPLACNYDAEANADDGSCDLTSCVGCTNPSACNYNPEASILDGSCDFFSCRGCTDAGAANFDPLATVEDGSCFYGGCLDPVAADYDAAADFDDGSCTYPGCTEAGACNFDFEANQNDGTCEFTSCAGCMITFACNYDAEATVQNDAACDFYSCCGDPTATNYEVGVADFLIYGCTYGQASGGMSAVGCDLPFACNYLDPDNDCEFSSCAGCVEEGACNYDPTATVSLTCFYAEDIYGVDYVDCTGQCWTDTDGDGVCDEAEIAGCTNPEACNFDAAATSDDGTCEAVSCGGCTDAEACNFDPEASVNDGSCTYTGCSGCTDLLACNFDAGAFLDDGSCVYDGCFGCSDPEACNHDPEAVLVDNANCLYPQDLYGLDHVDCEGLCIHDIDGDGICDEVEEPGCTDPSACNYSADATDDDGSCLLLDAVDVCGGPCAADANDNGICDALEASLCGPGTEWDAALGQCIEDGPVGTSGCTYVDATNFDAAATIDDGTCLFSVASPCPTDLNGDGVTGSPDLLMILGSYGEACE